MMKELEKLNVKPVDRHLLARPHRTGAEADGARPATASTRSTMSNPSLGRPARPSSKRPNHSSRKPRFKGINRYTMTGYAAAKVLIAAIERCGKESSWACTISELEKTKNVETGVMAPISFGPGVRFSNQKLQIMQSDFSTLSFKPVN